MRSLIAPLCFFLLGLATLTLRDRGVLSDTASSVVMLALLVCATATGSALTRRRRQRRD